MTPARRSIKITPKAGVYRITHLPSGRTLLGASGDAQAMLNRIRWHLEMKVLSTHKVNGHSLTALQRDWENDGKEAFAFEVLDELAPDELGTVERADLEELLALWRERLALPVEQWY